MHGIKEELLHFIWKFQLFEKSNLKTTCNKKVEVVYAGIENTNSGPDFLNAKVLIQKQLWVGNVEIHLKSSDWYAHNHNKDDAYNAVILHVVWQDDVEVFTKGNTLLPTFILKNKIGKSTLKNYSNLFRQNKKWINCEKEIKTTPSFIWNSWKDRLLIERIENKAKIINSVLLKTNNNWEKTLFLFLAKSFGLKINAEVFFRIAKSIPFSVVRKVAHQQFQLEALLLGQANLLTAKNELAYYNLLKEEYKYLTHKFNLEKPLGVGVQFFRLRPLNFPTIRLSQLAMLYHKNQNLFSEVINIKSLSKLYALFLVETSPFWKTHYTFTKESKSRVKKMSNAFVDLILINTILPFVFLYRKSIGKSTEDILHIYSSIKSEKNAIIDNFKNLQIKSKSAFDSQALLQLKNEYCNKQKCLYCATGNYLLKKEV